MQPEVQKLLRDMLDAGELIASFMQDVSFADYRQSKLVRSAVERQFITLGEALNAACRIDESLPDTISVAHKIIAFRNVLVHGYSIVSDDRVWGIATEDLPRLLAEVRALLPPS